MAVHRKVRRKNLLFVCSIWTSLDHVIFMLWTVLKRWDQRLFFPYFWLFFVCYEAPKCIRFRQKTKTKKEKKRIKEGEGEKWGRDAPNHCSCDLHRPLTTQKADCAMAAHDTNKFTITFNKSLCIHIRLKCPAPLILWNKGLKPFLLYFALNNRKQRTPTRFLHRLFLEEKAEIGKKKIQNNMIFINLSPHATYWENRTKIKKRPKISLRPFLHGCLLIICHVREL